MPVIYGPSGAVEHLQLTAAEAQRPSIYRRRINDQLHALVWCPVNGRVEIPVTIDPLVKEASARLAT